MNELNWYQLWGLGDITLELSDITSKSDNTLLAINCQMAPFRMGDVASIIKVHLFVFIVLTSCKFNRCYHPFEWGEDRASNNVYVKLYSNPFSWSLEIKYV